MGDSPRLRSLSGVEGTELLHIPHNARSRSLSPESGILGAGEFAQEISMRCRELRSQKCQERNVMICIPFLGRRHVPTSSTLENDAKRDSFRICTQ